MFNQYPYQVFNRYSFTVVIDELDSGIFEYLLGEMLDLLSKKGKGQLIFTSHNLRPLETIENNLLFSLQQIRQTGLFV